MAENARPRVLKFGGTSVGSPEPLRHALAIVQDAAKEQAVTVVVSALSGVTDQLAALAQGVGRGLDTARVLASLRERHSALLGAVASGPLRRDAEAAWAWVWTNLDRDLASMARGGDRTLTDSLLAAGERLAVPLFVAALRARGLPAEAVDGADVIRTDGHCGEANVNFTATRALVGSRLGKPSRNVVPIVTGFVGGTADGRTTVLGRGGSDLSAAILGVALGAEQVEIWTDVDGILSADPHLVENAFTLERLSYAEALTLARAGAKVLHPKTIPPLAESRIPVFVGNTRDRARLGSWVGTDGSPATGAAKAVASTAVNGHATICVLPSSPEAAVDLGERVLEVLASDDMSATPTTGAEAAVTVVVPTEFQARAVRAIHAALVGSAASGERNAAAIGR